MNEANHPTKPNTENAQDNKGTPKEAKAPRRRRKTSAKRNRKGKSLANGWNPWIITLLIGIVASLIANLVTVVLQSGMGFLEHTEIVCIAIFAGAIGGFITFFRVRRVLAGVVVFLIALSITCFIGFTFLVRHPMAEWDFDNGTTQDWGIYDEEKGRVILNVRVDGDANAHYGVPKKEIGKAESEGPTERDDTARTQELVSALKVVDLSQEFPDRGACLEVEIVRPTVSDTGNRAAKQWPAVQYEGELASTRLTASVFIPADAEFKYADVKFFLFAGPKWEWHDNGKGQDNEGVALNPGKWVDISWDLRPHNTMGWSQPWPWRGIFGIQVYVEGSDFRGPVYIDDVTVWK